MECDKYYKPLKKYVMRVNINKSEQRVYISRYTNVAGLTYSARKISF